jgi:hypothetical protein
MQAILQFIFTIIMYALMGMTVGIGIIVCRKYPQIVDFLVARPVLGWTAAFSIGAVIMLAAMTVIEMAALALLGLILR